MDLCVSFERQELSISNTPSLAETTNLLVVNLKKKYEMCSRFALRVLRSARVQSAEYRPRSMSAPAEQIDEEERSRASSAPGGSLRRPSSSSYRHSLQMPRPWLQGLEVVYMTLRFMFRLDGWRVEFNPACSPVADQTPGHTVTTVHALYVCNYCMYVCRSVGTPYSTVLRMHLAMMECCEKTTTP